MRKIHPLSAMVAAAAIAGCVAQDVAYDISEYTHIDRHCFTNAPKHLDGVNWSKARVIEVDIVNGQFSDPGITLKVGQPTILRFNNRDKSQRNFRSEEFMRAVALEYVSVGGKAMTRPCITGFALAAGKSTEMRLVPVTVGAFYPEDALAWYFGPREILSSGALGVISVYR